MNKEYRRPPTIAILHPDWREEEPPLSPETQRCYTRRQLLFVLVGDESSGGAAAPTRCSHQRVTALEVADREAARGWVERLVQRLEVAEAAHNALVGRVADLEERTGFPAQLQPVPGPKVWAVVCYAKSPGHYGVFFTQEAAEKRADELTAQDEDGHVYNIREWEVQ